MCLKSIEGHFFPYSCQLTRSERAKSRIEEIFRELQKQKLLTSFMDSSQNDSVESKVSAFFLFLAQQAEEIGVTSPIDINKLLGVQCVVRRLLTKLPFDRPKVSLPQNLQLEPIDMGMGYYAFGITISKGAAEKHLLFFPGTRFKLHNPGSGWNLVADLDPRGAGVIAFEEGRKSLERWMADKSNIVQFGYSLGGAIAVQNAVQDANQKIKKTITFDAPRTTLFVDQGKDLLEDSLFQFSVQRDVVPLLGKPVGDRRLGRLFIISFAKEKKFRRKQLHGGFLLNKRGASVIEDKEEKGSPLFRKLGYIFRVCVMTPLFLVVYAVLKVSRCLFGYHKKPGLFTPLLHLRSSQRLSGFGLNF